MSRSSSASESGFSKRNSSSSALGGVGVGGPFAEGASGEGRTSVVATTGEAGVGFGVGVGRGAGTGAGSATTLGGAGFGSGFDGAGFGGSGFDSGSVDVSGTTRGWPHPLQTRGRRARAGDS